MIFFFKSVRKMNSINLSDPLTFYDVITNVREDKYQFVNDWFNDI